RHVERAVEGCRGGQGELALVRFADGLEPQGARGGIEADQAEPGTRLVLFEAAALRVSLAGGRLFDPARDLAKSPGAGEGAARFARDGTEKDRKGVEIAFFPEGLASQARPGNPPQRSGMGRARARELREVVPHSGLLRGLRLRVDRKETDGVEIPVAQEAA